MHTIFNLDNPVWKFIGNLADFFILSILTFICSIPIVTAGAAFTSLSYVTLKMASGQEGKLFQQYFKCFRLNFKQATLIWLGFLGVGIVLCIDLYYGMNAGTNAASAMLITSIVCIVLWLCVFFMAFTLLARIDNTTSAIVKMAGAMAIRNFLPVISTVVVMVAFILVGLFIFWPILLVTPGLPAYINAFIFNRILTKYGFNLRDDDGYEWKLKEEETEKNEESEIRG